MCVGEWTYGGNVVLVNGYMEVLCVAEWTYGVTVCVCEWICGGIVCVGEWKYGGNIMLVNGYMEILCVLLNGHMEVMWCW